MSVMILPVHGRTKGLDGECSWARAAMAHEHLARARSTTGRYLSGRTRQ